MKDNDVKFFKTLAVILCVIVAIGIGMYTMNNYESPQEKLNKSNKELIDDMNKNQKEADELQRQLNNSK